MIDMKDLKKKDKVYLARVLPTVDIYEVLEVKVTDIIEDTVFLCEHKTKMVFPVNLKSCHRDNNSNEIFKIREQALSYVLEQEDKHRKNDIQEEENDV